ncbi:MAG: hypothetical protein J0G95_10880 [Rhizobiales bacterium]|nr:hypothetical protein [Hyphomicrobiales bacterium]
MYEPSSEHLQMAAQAAERLIGFYPSITASNPEVYAAGLMQVFSHYPEHLVAEAIDPVHGLPSESKFLPTISEVKDFLEPRYAQYLRMQAHREAQSRPKLERPVKDEAAEERVKTGFQQLSERLKVGLAP